METVLLIIQIIIIISMVGAILLQPSSNDGLGGLGGSGGNSLFSSRGTATIMTKTTAILAALFMFNSLLLAILGARSPDKGSLLDQYPSAVEQTTGETQNKTVAPEEGKPTEPTQQQQPAEQAPVVPLAE